MAAVDTWIQRPSLFFQHHPLPTHNTNHKNEITDIETNKKPLQLRTVHQHSVIRVGMCITVQEKKLIKKHTVHWINSPSALEYTILPAQLETAMKNTVRVGLTAGAHKALNYSLKTHLASLPAPAAANPA